MIFHNLETERLLLRSIDASDRAFMLREFSDDDVNRYLFDAEPLRDMAGADEIIAFYLQPEPRAQHRWILVSKDAGERLGTCGFHCWDRENGVAQLGYDMQKAHWGKGLMAEALAAALAFARDEMKLRRVDAHIYAENTRSIRLARRMGFVPSGEVLCYDFRGGRYPHDVYALYINA